MNEQPKSVSQEKRSEQVLAVQRIYTKGSLFEAATLTSQLLKAMPNPIVDMQAHAGFSEREDHTYEAVLTLQLTGKHEGNLLWRIQLQQAGLYTLKGFDDVQLKMVLNGYCMNQLYPYACAAASNIVIQGGFSPIYLGPMNFEMLYQEQQKQEKKQAAEKQSKETVKH